MRILAIRGIDNAYGISAMNVGCCSDANETRALAWLFFNDAGHAAKPGWWAG